MIDFDKVTLRSTRIMHVATGHRYRLSVVSCSENSVCPLQTWLGVNTFLVVTGSAIPRALFPALVAGGLSAVLDHNDAVDEFITEMVTGSQVSLQPLYHAAG